VLPKNSISRLKVVLDIDKLVMEPHSLRTRSQVRAQRTDRQPDIPETHQSAVTTLSETDRPVEVQTDQHTAHQSEYNILPTAPPLPVRPNTSGLISHAQETYLATSPQLSEDTTVDSIIQEPLTEDAGSAITDSPTQTSIPADLGRSGLSSPA